MTTTDGKERATSCIPLELVRRAVAARPGVWAFIDEIRAGRGSLYKNWPNWCFCPRTFFLQPAMADFPPERMREALRRMPPKQRDERLSMADHLTALAAWRMGMSIYRFDPNLAQSLIETPVAKLPVEVLYRLPEWCVYIEAPPGLPPDILGFFAHLEYQYNSEHPELHLVYVKKGKTPDAPPYMDLMFLRMDQPTIEAGAVAAVNQSIVYQAQYGLTPGPVHTRALEIARGESRFALPACLNLVLYLCADEADFGGKPRPRNPELVKTKRGVKLFAASAPRYWSMGQTLGGKLREAERLQSETGRSGPSPHLRRAHWHTYWVGKGRKELSVRWLHPILVGINAGKEPPDTVRD